MSPNKIQELISSLAKSVENNEELATAILAAKLAKCAEAYPHDQTIGAMSVVLEKMASNNTNFIKKAEFRSLYNKLYSRNTKFAELFKDELNIVEVEKPTSTYNRDDSTAFAEYETSDHVLANALNNAFDATVPVRTYSEKIANKALNSVKTTLDAWNLRPSKLSVDNGNKNFLILKADYETPKGITSVYVPVETSDEKVIEASIFMGNSGPQDLNNKELKNYITSRAGAKLQINASHILDALNKAAFSNREITQAELAVARLNDSRKQKSEFIQGQIVGQKIAEASVKDVELPKYDEFMSFEDKFTSPYGTASFNFGQDKVKNANDYITRELLNFGHKNPQVTVINSDNNTIYYGVSLDAGKVAFTVPVKINNGKISAPNLMICNGSISSFDKDGINQLYINNQTDYKVAAAASPQFDLKPSDLINNIRVALAEGNHAKAEDALNVLANSGDDKAYAMGFQAFMNGLSAEKVAENTCTMVIKNAKVSEHAICGHTGLPLHKVYQDKDGNCRPLYRRGMDETYEGASFMNSKIFG